MKVVLGDYSHSRAVKDLPDHEFVEVKPLYGAFARMVRTLEFDVCELALATYLQARDNGVPVTLLPVVMIGGTHHRSLTRLPDAPPLTPDDLRSRRVGVRSYSQTTGLWVRGLLREEYGVNAADVTWVTTEEPHVARYTEPPYVERSAAGTVVDLLQAGDVAAAVLGPRAVGGQGEGLVPLIEDAEAAGRAWVERHGTVPVNHVVVVRNAVLEEDPGAVDALYAALKAATAGAEPPVAAGWSEQLAKALEIGGRYALEQDLIRTAVDVAEIERGAARWSD
ncbi:ABC transporter substrate-binding protein [Actinoallomurus liliacearum]|uniref:ABC transporter substrate-binding protein n=1 Tax=Actinoallomurus liliacearum TaxID=1080073 RepID=A0ABP8TCC2_9ACTN